jgi:peptidoglycan/xylan/chitin deacetylase (PgdA/CDA1 family)
MKRLVVLLLFCLLCGCGAKPEPVESETLQIKVPQPQQEEPQEKTAGYVALTFDDGPTPRHTARLLDGLKERGASATFFLVGYRLEGNEGLVRRMKAEGHQIGNHSYDHVQLTTLSATAALADLVECDLALCTLLGEGDYWVRPPYGSISEEELAALGLPVICWSVDPLDWSCHNAQQVLHHIVEKAQDGDIILLHDCYESTVDAALQAVDALQARGLQVVTVAQLLAAKGVEVQSGRIYYQVG